MKKSAFFKIVFVVTAAILLIVLAGNTLAPPATDGNNITPAPTLNHVLPQDDTIRIGAFNVQVFGITKASKPEVMDVLAKIIRTYDIVAIQEIRDSTQTALPRLVDVVNVGGSQYAYVISERLGRTSSKEQYAYMYNTETVVLIDIPQTYPEPDGTDPFHREPYIASFRVLDGNFDATFLVIHTDPDEAASEIDTLDDAVSYAQSVHSGEQDFIVMGDLNADGTYFDVDGPCIMRGNEYTWIIDNSIDTTTGSNTYTYDRIIVTKPVLSDFTGESGAYYFDVEYGLTSAETTAVSDHYPVYMVLYANRDED